MPVAVTVSTPTPSRAEATAITSVAKGNAGILMHRLSKFYTEWLYRRNSDTDMKYNDMMKAGYLSLDLTIAETGEAVAILAHAVGDAVAEMPAK